MKIPAVRGLAALLFLLLPTALAQEADRSWRPLGPEEGLPSVEVFDLCASGDGRVWAATAAGLCRVEAEGITLVTTERARRVATAPDGTVYALTEGRILHVTEDGVETPIPLPGPDADSLRTDATGTLWLFAGDAVYRRAPDGPWEQPARPDPPDDLGLPAAERPAGAHRAIRFRMEVWAATMDRGILRQRLVPRFRPFELPGVSRINALAAAPDGTIWCGTERGLASIDADGGVALFPNVDGKPFGAIT
ncbi:MAG: hypothetical protein OER88_09335, partial [Planctomycetota bacterium]|nr:hypothetical protein [Planctomycetota bacterium]